MTSRLLRLFDQEIWQYELYVLLDEQVEYQIAGRLSFQRFHWASWKKPSCCTPTPTHLHTGTR